MPLGDYSEAQALKVSNHEQELSNSINSRIEHTSTDLQHAISTMEQSCPYTPEPEACKENAQTLKAKLPYKFVNQTILTAYKSAITHIKDIIQVDLQTAHKNESLLSAIEKRATKIYNDPN